MKQEEQTKMACALCGFKLDSLDSINFKHSNKVKGRSHISCVRRFVWAKTNDTLRLSKLGAN